MSGSLIDSLLQPDAANRLRVATTAAAMQALATGRHSALWRDGHLVIVDPPAPSEALTGEHAQLVDRDAPAATQERKGRVDAR